MEKIIDRTRCTGCTACAMICPKNAIIIQKDNEGFGYPIINQKKCIDCGLCKRTCPVLNTEKNAAINKCYVAYAKDSKMSKGTSSGGIFSVIAKNVLENEGIVIGAAFNKNNELYHIAVNKNEDLDRLKGSKYLQSDLNNIFHYIKENINQKKILFVGVPCQVAGLKAFLQRDYKNLICIDLICHGVPSPKLFEKYLKELEELKKDKIVMYNFRDKSTGWDTYSNTIIFEREKVKEPNTKNKYMRIFLSNAPLRESCFNCNFKLGNKYSDITLGDFWGVKKYYPEMYNKKGVSAVIINTENGTDIFEKIKDELEYKPCKIDEIINGNPSLTESARYYGKRLDFFRDLDKCSIRELEKKYVKKEKFIVKLKNRIIYFVRNQI